MKRLRAKQFRVGRRGFTMVELMVVVTLVGVLAAFSAPTIARSMERSRVANLNRALASSFSEARSFAMSRGQAVFVQINPGGGTNEDGSVVFFLPANFQTGADTCALANVGGGPQANNTILDVDVGSYGATTELRGVDPGNLGTVCLAPNGRVLDAGGGVISAGGQGCGGMNLILQVASPDAPQSLYSSCPGDDEDETRLERDIYDVYQVHVAFSGKVGVWQ